MRAARLHVANIERLLPGAHCPPDREHFIDDLRIMSHSAGTYCPDCADRRALSRLRYRVTVTPHPPAGIPDTSVTVLSGDRPNRRSSPLEVTR